MSEAQVGLTSKLTLSCSVTVLKDWPPLQPAPTDKFWLWSEACQPGLPPPPSHPVSHTLLGMSHLIWPTPTPGPLCKPSTTPPQPSTHPLLSAHPPQLTSEHSTSSRD